MAEAATDLTSQDQTTDQATDQVTDTSIVDTPPVETPEVPQDFPDNWRTLLTEDEKELKQLERMKSPKDVYKSYRELEKIKSRFTPAPEKPGEGASEEDIKAYREYYDIPEDPKGYDLSFEDGTVPGEDVAPYLEGFLQFAHENNLPKDVVKNSVHWYLDDAAKQQQKMRDANDEARVNGIASLKSEWGGEYQGNINSIQSLFTEAPEGTMEALMGARDADGIKFANNPDNIKWLVGLAQALNPTASLLPAGANDDASIDAEIDKIKGWMQSKDPAERDKYWKDPKVQERYTKLTQAKQR